MSFNLKKKSIISKWFRKGVMTLGMVIALGSNPGLAQNNAFDDFRGWLINGNHNYSEMVYNNEKGIVFYVMKISSKDKEKVANAILKNPNNFIVNSVDEGVLLCENLEEFCKIAKDDQLAIGIDKITKKVIVIYNNKGVLLGKNN